MFVAAEVGSCPAEVVAYLGDHGSRVHAVRSGFELEIELARGIRLAFLWWAGPGEDVVVDLATVLLEAGGSVQFLDGLVSTYLAVGVDPLDESLR